jgi:hypothetical protein
MESAKCRESFGSDGSGRHCTVISVDLGGFGEGGEGGVDVGFAGGCVVAGAGVAAAVA